jgi:hypothetical protein
MFKEEANGSGVIFGSDESEWTNLAQTAVESKLLQTGEHGFTVSRSHPKTKPALKALNELRAFLASPEATEELYDDFEQARGYTLEADNRDLWNDELDSRLRPM